MSPIWKYRKNITKTKQDRHYTLTKTDGAQTKTLPGRMARWAEWVNGNFQIKPKELELQIMHIPDHQWEKRKAIATHTHENEYENKYYKN